MNSINKSIFIILSIIFVHIALNSAQLDSPTLLQKLNELKENNRLFDELKKQISYQDLQNFDAVEFLKGINFKNVNDSFINQECLRKIDMWKEAFLNTSASIVDIMQSLISGIPVDESTLTKFLGHWSITGKIF